MLPEAVTKLIGQAGEVVMMEVEKGAIKRFAHAIGDSNPLHLEEEYARNSRYGAIVAPPGFFGWPTRWSGTFPGISSMVEPLMAPLTEAGLGRILDAGIEYEFFIPVRAGDVLAALPRITHITERETKGVRMVFSVIETTYTNQGGQLAARARQTFISR